MRSVALLSLVLLASTSSCTRVLEYPSEEPERSAVLCADSVDNDFDGLKDCDDPDCDGHCHEESLSACADRRDNDGDGLADAADPRCWLLKPPRAMRCAKAEGADIVDHFDRPPALVVDPPRGYYFSTWAGWGLDASNAVVQYKPHAGPRRRDLLLAFEGNTTSSELLSANLGAYVRQPPFSGSWQGFRLSFSAAAPPLSLLRVAIVPVGLVPSIDAPPPGVEGALFAVVLDALQTPPTLGLDIDRLHFESPLEPGESGCDSVGACEDGMGRVVVSMDATTVRAAYSGPDGHAELEAAVPPGNVPPSRLVLWGGSSGAGAAQLDDLELSIKPELPCGFAVPQIPGASCENRELLGFGYSTSVARGPEGEYCALVTASHWDSDAHWLTPPDGLTAWQSPDGDHWTMASNVALPVSSARLVGAGIAADADGWHAVVSYFREGEDNPELAFIDGTTCARWGQPSAGPALVEDAEAPSYVIDHGRHEIYFTRPPVEANRTLWRLMREAPASEPELLPALPPGVQAPVSVGLLGTSDRVLVYPSTAVAGGRGVGLLVGDARGNFQPVGSGPLLALPASPDLPAGGGRLGFDDRDVLSATLGWAGSGGFLMYGGRSTHGRIGGDLGTPILNVGTAHLVVSDGPLLAAATVPDQNCGDGTCEGVEDCVTCAADCACPGVELLRDVLGDQAAWSTVSSDASPEAIRYFRTAPPALNFAGGAPTWSARPLERPISGDFELSFDVLVEYSDFEAGGTLYVGLGTTPAEQAGTNSALAPGAGVFARFSSCEWTSYPAPAALVGGTWFAREEDDCYGGAAQAMGEWQHVVLRREGGTVRVLVPNATWQVEVEDAARCGSDTHSVVYAGAAPPFSHLLVGFGGGAFDASPTDGTFGTLKNLALRLPDDPEACPAGEERCSVDSEQPSCVDVSVSPEHCGSCGRRCAANEVCSAGQCVCVAGVGETLRCEEACVDSLTSLAHCGRCGKACAERCVLGQCDAIEQGACESPFEIPAEGGALGLVFPAGGSEAFLFCGATAVDPLIGVWTPDRSGTAALEVDVGEQDLSGSFAVDSIVAISEDPSCAEWQFCNDDIDRTNLGSHLEFAVEAGTTYRIQIALWYYRPPRAQGVELRVFVE